MKTDFQAVVPFAKDSSDQDYAALNRFANCIRSEKLPDDPPVTVEETIQSIQSIPPFVDLRVWACWDEQGEILASANIVTLQMEANQHLAQFDVSVLPAYRRQGFGRRLLERIAAVAQEQKRRLLVTSSVDRIPSGEAFLRRIGAKKALEAHTNQLCIVDLDRALLSDWLARSQENCGEFELGFWDGPYPEAQLQAVAALHDLTNQQPRGELEIEDIHMTPEQIRQMENNLFARGQQRWTYYVIERATGRFAGYTETIWNPNRPEILQQDMTGVFPQFRNRGLGRWLKAAMLDKVLKERPQVKYVRTGNADSNAAMLKINQALGFKPYTADSLWQVELTTIQAYLQQSAERLDSAIA